MGKIYLILAIACFIAIGPMGHAYYIILKVGVMAGYANAAFIALKNESRPKWIPWICIALSIIFNFNLHFSKSIWCLIDLISAAVFILLAFNELRSKRRFRAKYNNPQPIHTLKHNSKS